MNETLEVVRAPALDAAPTAEMPANKGARHVAREQYRHGLEQQIVTLRSDGKTWAEVAAAMGLSHSRVREHHCERDAAAVDHKMALRARFAAIRRMRAGRRAADRIGKFAGGEVITQHAQVLLRRTASRAASRAPLFAPTLSKMPCYRPRRQHTRVSAGNASS